MSIFKKLLSAARGHATELGEEIVDANALTILDQEIRDAKVELDRSKTALADIIGKRKIQADKVTAIKADIAKYEKHAMDLDESSDLFTEVCTKLDALASQLGPLESIVKTYDDTEAQLKTAVKNIEASIKSTQSQVDTVKATEQVQRAQSQVASKFAGNNSSLSSAKGSLERIKEKQAVRAAQLAGAQEVNSMGVDDLDARLNASSGSSAADRLRAKKAKKSAQ